VATLASLLRSHRPTCRNSDEQINKTPASADVAETSAGGDDSLVAQNAGLKSPRRFGIEEPPDKEDSVSGKTAQHDRRFCTSEPKNPSSDETMTVVVTNNCCATCSPTRSFDPRPKVTSAVQNLLGSSSRVAGVSPACDCARRCLEQR
jgi:hypothetical protein